MSDDYLGGLEPPDPDDYGYDGKGKLPLVERRNRIGGLQITKARTGEPVTLDDARDVCGDATTNYVATVMFSCKPGFMGLRREGRSSPPTYVNVYRAVKAMQPARVVKVVADLGLSPQEFAEWVNSLPRD